MDGSPARHNLENFLLTRKTLAEFWSLCLSTPALLIKAITFGVSGVTYYVCQEPTKCTVTITPCVPTSTSRLTIPILFSDTPYLHSKSLAKPQLPPRISSASFVPGFSWVSHHLLPPNHAHLPPPLPVSCFYSCSSSWLSSVQAMLFFMSMRRANEYDEGHYTEQRLRDRGVKDHGVLEEALALPFYHLNTHTHTLWPSAWYSLLVLATLSNSTGQSPSLLLELS